MLYRRLIKQLFILLFMLPLFAKAANIEISEAQINQYLANKLGFNEPNFFFVKKDFNKSLIYEGGFKIDELFVNNASGITTERDNITIHFEESTLHNIIQEDDSTDLDDISTTYTYNSNDYPITSTETGFEVTTAQYFYN